MSKYTRIRKCRISLSFPLLLPPLILSACAVTSDKPFRPETVTSDKPFGPETVFIPSGCFYMGNEVSSVVDVDEVSRFNIERKHKVCVDAFRIGKYEVTVGEWTQFIRATEYQTAAERPQEDPRGCWAALEYSDNVNWRQPGYVQQDDYPATCVSLNDVQAYIEWLNAQTGRHYRLPTEAEWEYACRGGNEGERYCGGNDVNTVAWHYTDEAEWRPHPVGKKSGNKYGLFDMSGNIAEWTCSTLDVHYSGFEKKCRFGNPEWLYVFRGGSWFSAPEKVRAASREYSGMDARTIQRGFRIVEDL